MGEALGYIEKNSLQDLTNNLPRPDISYGLNFASITFYAIDGIFLVLPMRHSVMTFSPGLSFNKIYYSCFAFVVTLYATFGIVNALKFGNETKEIIFYNYKPSDKFIFAGEVGYTFVLFCSNCINLFPVYTSFYDIPPINNFLIKHVT